MVTKLRIRRPGRLDIGTTEGVLHPLVDAALAKDSPVAIGVSGGKDSCAAAIAAVEYLRAIGHAGPVVLVHADLGRVEWSGSIRVCRRLAEYLGVELVVVRREAGDMMDRWLQRWRDNVRRYESLLCVKIILPWSTPSMRFCTSEMKIAVICRDLVARFPGQTIVSVAGVRRSESDGRSTAATAKAKQKLTSKTHRTTGIDWNPIAHWDEADVFAFCADRGFDLHEGYTKFGMTRISCAFCIMANAADLRASASNPEHADLLREMVGLEIKSTFAFQGDSWLADVDPALLDNETRAKLEETKRLATQRQAIEARIPDHLLYEKGWPKVMPTQAEAESLCAVRREVGDLLGLAPQYVTPEALIARYAELMALNAARTARKERS